MSTEERGLDERVGGGRGGGGGGGDVGMGTGVMWDKEGRRKGDDGCVAHDPHLSTPREFDISSAEVDQLLEGQGTVQFMVEK